MPTRMTTTWPIECSLKSLKRTDASKFQIQAENSGERHLSMKIANWTLYRKTRRLGSEGRSEPSGSSPVKIMGPAAYKFSASNKSNKAEFANELLRTSLRLTHLIAFIGSSRFPSAGESFGRKINLVKICPRDRLRQPKTFCRKIQSDDGQSTVS
jgi:hypothetical protein